MVKQPAILLALVLVVVLDLFRESKVEDENDDEAEGFPADSFRMKPVPGRNECSESNQPRSRIAKPRPLTQPARL